MMSNRYENMGCYIVMYTSKNEPIYIDKEDYEKVKDITWRIDNNGYAVGEQEGATIKMHRLIMGFPDNKVIDHKHGKLSRCDNRKSNLRIANYTQNAINKSKQSNNTSGCTGVSFDKGKQRWRAEIWCKKRIHIGWFVNFEDAVNARKEAEEKYFGEWSYANSQEHRKIEENDE